MLCQDETRKVKLVVIVFAAAFLLDINLMEFLVAVTATALMERIVTCLRK